MSTSFLLPFRPPQLASLGPQAAASGAGVPGTAGLDPLKLLTGLNPGLKQALGRMAAAREVLSGAADGGAVFLVAFVLLQSLG